MRKRRNYIAIAILCLFALGMTGCAQRVDDIGMETDGSDTVSDTGQTEDTPFGNGALRDALGLDKTAFLWDETIRLGEGDREYIHFSDTIELPHVSSLSVVKSRTYTTDEKDRERIAKAIFGNEIIDDSDACKDRDVLERKLAFAQEMKQGKELEKNSTATGPENEERIWASITGAVDYYKDQIARYKKALSNPQQNPERISDFSGTDYRGVMDGLEYTLSFARGGEESPVDDFYDEDFYVETAWSYYYDYEAQDRVVDLEVADGVMAHAPKELAEKDCYPELWRAPQDYRFYYENDQYNTEHGAIDQRLAENNLCGFSGDEAVEKADVLLEKLGFSGLIPMYVFPLTWCTEDDDIRVTDGYELVYLAGSGGLPLTDEAGFVFYDDRHYMYDQVIGTLPGNGSIRVYLNGEGILKLFIENMVVKQSEEADVTLLSFEQIQRIATETLTKELTDTGGHYDSYADISDITLQYWRITDPEPDQFTFLPVWVFRELEYRDPTRLVINAIDGSVIASNPVVHEKNKPAYKYNPDTGQAEIVDPELTDRSAVME